MKKKWLAIGIILLFVGTSLLPIIPSCRAESEEYYFEDVYVVITGRCRTIGSLGEWLGGLFIGNQSHPSIQAFDTPLERININIYEHLKSNPLLSLKRVKNIAIHLIDTKGIFFWGCWKQYSAGPIPPIIFVLCQAERVSVYC